MNFLQLAELLNDEFEGLDSVDEKIDRLRDLMGILRSAPLTASACASTQPRAT